MEEGKDIATKKSDHYNIRTEGRFRRKTRVVGELASDVGLTQK